jgi:hypothetical protein
MNKLLDDHLMFNRQMDDLLDDYLRLVGRWMGDLFWKDECD